MSPLELPPGRPDGEQLPQRWQAHPESAAAGLWTTADDLGRFLAALTASISGVDETLLPTAWTERMITAVKPAGKDMQVGHGLFIIAGGQEFGHGGVNIGYNASIAGTVDGRFAVAVVTNSDPGGITLAEEVTDTIATPWAGESCDGRPPTSSFDQAGFRCHPRRSREGRCPRRARARAMSVE